MERELYADDIPEERPLSDAERRLVQWMLEHGESHAPEFLPQLEQATVRSRCRCGCASINFAVADRHSFDRAMDILSDYVWEDNEGHKFGAFVFAHGGLLAGLDLSSVDGAVTPTWLPKPEELIELPLKKPEV
jgi:hypothetical protein